MKLLSKIETLSPSLQDDIRALCASIENSNGNGDLCLNAQKEKLADLLNQTGLHEESREYLHDVLQLSLSPVESSRLLRKISSSHTAQRQYVKAQFYAEEALALLQKVDAASIDELQLFETLTACAFANYFISRAERLKELIKEMRQHFPSVTDRSVQLRFYFVVMCDILLRHRWYMLPEESLTHGEFYLQLALETGDANTIGSAYSGLGFVHLWREEFAAARLNFEKAFESFQDKNTEFVLTCQVYTTVSYRMQNNISMTERWAAISKEVASNSNNNSYLALTYGNLAWVSVKRGNWLYAEEYARLGLGILLPLNHPMIFLCIFPLLACLQQHKNYREAGKYCYLLLLPGVKGLPVQLCRGIEAMNIAWVTNNEAELASCLDNVLHEAKLANYL